jgi:electron transfer flavoprotein beta subunit
MTVVVGYLWVAGPKEATVLPDGTVTWPGVRRIVGESERVAIEFARTVAEATGSRVVGITVGDAATANPQAANAGLAAGLDEAVIVQTEQPPGTAEASAAMAAVIRGLDDVELVVLGNSASDSGTRMFGPYLGGLLGWPVLGDVTDAGLEEGGIWVDAESQRSSRRYRMESAAVLSVSVASRTPRQMGLRDIMAAGSKPSKVVTAAELGAAGPGAVRVISTANLELSSRRGRVIAGTAPEAAAEVMAELVARGVL